MFLTIACGILSLMVGIPRGGFLLLVLGMYIPFVGCVWPIDHWVGFTPCVGVLIFSLSIPVVALSVLI